MTRGAVVAAMVAATLAIGMPAAIRPAPRLVWNATASVPVGLYRVRPTDRLRVGDLVVAMPPEPLARFLAKRGYLPIGAPLLKRVAALPGQTICRRGHSVGVDGAVIAKAFDRDRRDRDLPVWSGCRVVADGEVFLINRRPADSLDGRYFGPLPASGIAGRAVPVWTSKEE